MSPSPHYMYIFNHEFIVCIGLLFFQKVKNSFAFSHSRWTGFCTSLLTLLVKGEYMLSLHPNCSYKGAVNIFHVKCQMGETGRRLLTDKACGLDVVLSKI